MHSWKNDEIYIIPKLILACEIKDTCPNKPILTYEFMKYCAEKFCTVFNFWN
jgi:hypothetical protein